MSAKVYNTSPLPFMGQKRNFVKLFREALQEFPTATTFVDLFGGSGLLSHVVKRQRPDAHVVYNDYDDFHHRIENVERTNAIIAKIRTPLDGVPRLKKVPGRQRQTIIDLLKECEQTGFVDYITISSSFYSPGITQQTFERLKSKRSTILPNRRPTPATDTSTGWKSSRPTTANYSPNTKIPRM